MQTKTQWAAGVAQGVIASIVYAVIAFVSVALVTRYRLEWSTPILRGLIAAALFASIIALLKLTKRLGSLPGTSVENIEERITTWLHYFGLTLRKDADPKDFYFRIIVTTDGGKKIALVRSRTEWPEYLSLVAGIELSDSEKAALAALNEVETLELMTQTKIELGRARIGYSGLNSIDHFTIFKRMPINNSLDVNSLLDAVWEMEAVLNIVFALGVAYIGRSSVAKAKLEGPSKAN